MAVLDNKEISKALWGNFVHPALATGQLQAKPDPVVVGRGLDAVQHAVDVQQAGLSAKKVVVVSLA